MAKVTDINGVDWVFAINTATAKKVFDHTGLNLLSERFDDVVEKLSDLMVMGEVLFCLCEKQIDSRGLDYESFAASFNGDALRIAWEAMLDELVNFIQVSTTTAIWKGAKKAKAAQAKQAEKVIEMGAIEKMIDQTIAKEEERANAAVTAMLSGEPSTE